MQRLCLNGEDWTFKEFLGEDWVWRDAHKRETKDVRFWKKGSVPSSVTHDLYRCGEIPDPYFEKNSLLLEWIPERTWIYRKAFRLPAEMAQKEVNLCFEGIDYEAIIYLNDTCLGTHKGMFTQACFPVTEIIRPEEENLLAVVLQKAPDEQPQVSKSRYVKTHKSRMTYWWDFCPRMIHQGIWDDVYLEAYQESRIQGIQTECTLAKEEKAELTIEVELEHIREGSRLLLDCEILQEDGKVASLSREIKAEGAIAKVSLHTELSNPKLWWPNGYGGQPLYEVKVRLLVKKEEGYLLSQEKSVVFGIREIRFQENEGGEPGAKAYTLWVNGRRIYMKGWNWVPMDVLYGVKRQEKLEHLFLLIQDAHVNMLRVWGGGLIEREEFYRLCDERGILVWQEFIQSSSGIDNQPPSEPEFLRMMEEQARQIIPRKKNHPSLAVWGGGNELQGENGTMIQDGEPVIALLKRLVEELDASRYFLASSPTGRVFNNTLEQIGKDPDGLHDVHGPWEHQGLKEQYTLYNKGTSLLSSEFGVEGMANEQTLRAGMSEVHLWPPSRDNSYYFHRGSWWNNYPLLQSCFGEQLKDIGQTIKASQLLQFEGLRYAVEANRRRAMHLSGTFPWQFNEPYPNNTCTSAVDYYGLPKPAYYAVKQAYAPAAVSASFASQSWGEEEIFEAKIYGQTSFEAGRLKITARIRNLQGRISRETQFQVQSQEETAVYGGTIKIPVKEIDGNLFFLQLFMEGMEGEIQTENCYLFTKSNLAPLLNLKETQIKISVLETEEENTVHRILELFNIGETAAVGLKLETKADPEGKTFIQISENYGYLFPGEKRRTKIRGAGKDMPELFLEAFNVNEK